jgi:hypothetical protein
LSTTEEEDLDKAEVDVAFLVLTKRLKSVERSCRARELRSKTLKTLSRLTYGLTMLGLVHGGLLPVPVDHLHSEPTPDGQEPAV